MKECITCKKIKNTSEFGKKSNSKDGLNSKCKECKRNYDNRFHKNRSNESKKDKLKTQYKRLADNRKIIFEFLKGKSCKECGESRIQTLEFHHLRDKKFNVSEGITGGYSVDLIMNEINKCEILCANCHRMETSKDFQWYKNIEV